MKAETKSAMTLEEFKLTPEYAACSDKMKLWLVTLIENGFDYTAATASAFDCTYPRVFSYAVRNWAKVRAALNLYLGRSEQDVFLDELQKTIRRAPLGSDRQVRAQALYARLKWNVQSPASEEPEAPATSISKSKALAPADPRIPPDHLEVWSDPKTGVAIGYRAADGTPVKL